MSDIAIENGHRNSDFSHQTWWCSIVMWQFTRPGKCFSPVQYDLGSMGWDSHPWTWNTRYAKPPKIRETSMFLIQNCGFRHILPPQPNIFLSLQAYYEAHLGKESFPRMGFTKWTFCTHSKRMPFLVVLNSCILGPTLEAITWNWWEEASKLFYSNIGPEADVFILFMIVPSP